MLSSRWRSLLTAPPCGMSPGCSKKQRTAVLEQKAAELRQENAALAKLLAQLQLGAATSLIEPSEQGIDSWLSSVRF